MKKAFLLGAGLGTRLRPLTNVLPKPLIPVFHRPLITHAIDHCLGVGVADFAINTHHLPDAWENFYEPWGPTGAPEPEEPPEPDPEFADYQATCSVTYRTTLFHEPELLETGGGIRNIADWIDGDPLLVYNGDILTNLPLEKLLAAHRASGNVVTLALRSRGPQLHIALDGERVTDLSRRLGVAEGSHQFTGIYCIEPELLELIPPNEKISVIPAFLELIREGRLGGCVLDEGYWLDLGTREAYLAAHRPGSPLEEEADPVDEHARIDPSAEIIDSVVGPGCVVGAGAVVRNSVLWPRTEVAPEAALDRCIVYSSKPATGQHREADL